ncbi:hypothetical protein AT05_03800 [Schleiferia thermophila str. Yellowstone]|jgi:hypothetical protein|uniref:Uncharacterized protein n=1 Tax=Schleiferia thermophila TaxID=884107 RepID=A0A369A977_9FLAO|nr:hypothetical protein AT05_03800 [Schleiferia thermophila str. Yellowstone]RCX03964.1 hypothetical protein DES35_102423 [Schleiferia thermophila]GCD80197.1 hypothetical protein JCM30197_14440 [Schleiferia thermophila]
MEWEGVVNGARKGPEMDGNAEIAGHAELCEPVALTQGGPMQWPICGGKEQPEEQRMRAMEACRKTGRRRIVRQLKAATSG